MVNKEKTLIVYLSGGMTGYNSHNFPAFNAAAKDLREQGYIVLNPAENDNGDTSGSWQYYMRQDLKHVSDADLVIVLDGWERSEGANLEVLCAAKLKMPILKYPSLLPVDNSHLPKLVKYQEGTKEPFWKQAYNLVFGDRNESYGSCYEDFNRTASIWNGLFAKKLKPDAKFTPKDIGYGMLGVKLSRLANKFKEDSLIDLYGYLMCIEQIHEVEADAKQTKT